MKKILFFVLWFGFIFASCKNAQESINNTPEMTTHKVTFSVVGGNGKVKVSVEGDSNEYTDGTKGIDVVKGKKVTFIATPDNDYVVENWLKNTENVTNQATENSTKYVFTVNGGVEIKVKFKQKTPLAPETVKVNFSVVGGNGKLKVSVEGDSNEYTDGTKGIDVVKGKKVTFIAIPDNDYVVENWLKNTENVTNQTTENNTKYVLTVNGVVIVKVKFKKKAPQTHTLTFEVDGEGGTLKAEYFDDGTPIATSPATVEHGKSIMLSATSNNGFQIAKWTHDGKVVNGVRQGYDLIVDKDTVVKVSFKKKLTKYRVISKVVDNVGGTLTLKTEDGEGLNSPIAVVEDNTLVIFTASPQSDYEIEQWSLNGSILENKKDNEYRIRVNRQLKVEVKFKRKATSSSKIMKVKFSFDNKKNGAEIEGVEGKLNSETDIVSVEKGKTIIFPAKPIQNYVVESCNIIPKYTMDSTHCNRIYFDRTKSQWISK